MVVEGQYDGRSGPLDFSLFQMFCQSQAFYFAKM